MINRRNFIKKSLYVAGASSIGLPGYSFGKSLLPNNSQVKTIIFLHMNGGPSQMDLFDYKPDLFKMAGKSITGFTSAKGQVGGTIIPPVGKFKQYGESGRWVSDLLPHLSQHVDKMSFVKSVVCESMNHYVAQLEQMTGSSTPGADHIANWISLFKKKVDNDLPDFTLFQDELGHLRSYPECIGFNQIKSKFSYNHFDLFSNIQKSLNGILHDEDHAKKFIDYRNQLNLNKNTTNHQHVFDARAELFNMTYKSRKKILGFLQNQIYGAFEKKYYGIEKIGDNNFADQLIFSKNLIKSEVPFVQISLGNEDDVTSWDQHGNIKDIYTMTKKMDHALSGYIYDLEREGLLDQSVILWAGEFGRLPVVDNVDAEGGNVGRGHNNMANTVWMLGKGIKQGFEYGKTDDLSLRTVENPVNFGDIWATLLHLIGIDHEEMFVMNGDVESRFTKRSDKIISDILV